MKDIPNSQILREAPNLVEYGIKKGLIRKPVNRIDHLKEYFRLEKQEKTKFRYRDPLS